MQPTATAAPAAPAQQGPAAPAAAPAQQSWQQRQTQDAQRILAQEAANARALRSGQITQQQYEQLWNETARQREMLLGVPGRVRAGFITEGQGQQELAGLQARAPQSLPQVPAAAPRPPAAVQPAPAAQPQQAPAQAQVPTLPAPGQFGVASTPEQRAALQQRRQEAQVQQAQLDRQLQQEVAAGRMTPQQAQMASADALLQAAVQRGEMSVEQATAEADQNRRLAQQRYGQPAPGALSAGPPVPQARTPEQAAAAAQRDFQAARQQARPQPFDVNDQRRRMSAQELRFAQAQRLPQRPRPRRP